MIRAGKKPFASQTGPGKRRPMTGVRLLSLNPTQKHLEKKLGPWHQDAARVAGPNT